MRILIHIAICAVIFFPHAALATSIAKADRLLTSYKTLPQDSELESLKAKLDKIATEFIVAGLNDLGSVWAFEKKLLAKAEKALEIRKTLYGELNEATMLAEYDLARIYGRFGWPDAQEAHLVQAMKIAHRLLGQDHRFFGDLLVFLGRIRSVNGFDRIAPLIGGALHAYEKALGNQSLDYVDASLFNAGVQLQYSRAGGARFLAEQSLKTLDSLDEIDHSLLFEAREIVALTYQAERHTEKAIDYVNESLSLLASIDEYKTRARCSNEKRQAQSLPAIRSLRLCKGSKRIQEGRLYSFLSGLHNGKYDRQQAEEYQRRADKLFRATRQQVRYARMFRRGEYEELLEMLLPALPGIRIAYGDDHPAWADYAISVGSLRQALGDFQGAIRDYTIALDVSRKYGTTQIVHVASLYENLGILYAFEGDTETADFYFNSSEELFELLPNVRRYAGALQPINLSPEKGMIYMVLGRYKEAEGAYRDTLQATLSARGERHVETRLAYMGMVNFYAGLNYKSKASQMLEAEINHSEEYGYPRLERKNMEASLAILQEKYKKAIAIYTEILPQIKEALGPKSLVVTLIQLNRALALLKSDQFDKAVNHLQEVQGVQFFRRQKPHILASLKTFEAEAQLGAGRTEKAIKLLDTAIVDLAESDFRHTLWTAYSVMSDALKRKDNVEGAIFFGKLAVNGIQSERQALGSFNKEIQQAFLRDKSIVYRRLADNFIESGNLVQAKEVLSMLKQFEYSKFITRDNAAENALGAIALSDQERDISEDYLASTDSLLHIRRAITQLQKIPGSSQTKEERKQLKTLRGQSRAVRRKFSNEFASIRKEFSSLNTQRNIESGEKSLGSLRAMQDTPKRMGNNVALINYLVLPDKLRIVLTTRDDQYAFASDISSDELNSLIFEFREQLENPGSDPLETAQKLYHYLVSPIADVLTNQGSETLLASLDSTLRYIPLGALHDGKQYLTERYQISRFTPSAQLPIERLPIESWNIAAFGVSEESSGFIALPAVVAELDGIVKENEGDPQGVLSGVQYLNASFTSDQLSEVLNNHNKAYQVIHVASHFSFLPGKESDSFLLTGNGGRLTMDDLKYGEFPLQNVDLFTLSACNTAVGSVEADGAEVESLGTLVQNQGASAVMATLWSVADESTSQFMRGFYQTRAEQGSSNPAGMQKIQKEFIASSDQTDDYSHPFFWAPFILMGNIQ